MCRAREFTAAVQRLGQRRAWHEALQVLESMESQALQANLIVHNAVLTALRRHWPCALQLFAALPARRLRPDGVSVNALMASDGLTKRRTLELLREMPRRLLSPDVVTFGAACSACEVETAWQDALNLLGEARALKICSTILCSSVISACGKGKQWQIALDLLKSMEDLVFQRVQPNVISFNSAMNACGRGSQWPLAVALLQRMARQSLRPTAASFGAVVAATGRKGLWRMALLLMERMEEEGLEVNPWLRRGITWTCRKAKVGDFRMNLGTSQGTWADAANSGWEKALFQCWETLKDPLQRSSGSSAWYDLLPPNEVLKLLHLSGKAWLAEDLWQQMAVLGVQGLIGCLVMMDVWQARCDRRCLLLATSGASQQIRSAWKSNKGDETWTTVEDSMDWAGQILQVNDMFYALEVNRRSVFGHLHGTFRSSLSSLAQLRKLRSDQSWGDAASLQDTVLEQHFSLGLYFTPVALNELGLRYLDPDEKNWVLQCSRLFGRCFEFSVEGDKSDPNFNG